MFWKDKKAREAIAQLRNHLGFHYTNWDGTFDQEVNSLVKDINEALRTRDEKLDLILKHLNLKYVPATEKKEKAKLVEIKKNP